MMIRTLLLATALAASVLAAPARADAIPQGWAASNMKPVGYSDLGGRTGAFKLTIKQVAGKWYLIMGHLWTEGWTVLDVTDPANPKVAKVVQGPANTVTEQVSLHDNILVTALQKPKKDWGHDYRLPSDEGVLFWDVSDPINWKLLSQWKTGGRGTHRNSYQGGKYAFISAALPGYRNNVLVILDISDPRNPKEAGRYVVPGQKEEEPRPNYPVGYHGPATLSADGKMLVTGDAPYFLNLDISDVHNPKPIGKLQFSPPFIQAGAQSEHSILPIHGGKLVHINSEASAENCDQDALNFAGLIDNADPAKPRLLSLYPLPLPPKDAPYTSFCDKGGRFGPHNTNQEQHLPDVEKTGNLMYLTYFNAGLRIYDIKDPRQPQETGWFIPPQPTKRLGPQPLTKLVNQTEDVLVDTRGVIYITDKQWGVFVLRYTGPDQPAPTAKDASQAMR